MSLMQRARRILAAVFMIVCAGLVFYMGGEGFRLVALFMSLSLILYAARTLAYYFFMARRMVDGKWILFKGVILLDCGVLSLSIADEAAYIVILYIIAVCAFTGVVTILRALEAVRYRSRAWRLTMAEGLLNIGFAAASVVCGFGMRNLKIVCWIYASGLVYSAILKMISVFRRTAIVYIP